jgi:hypothetical protein
MLRIRGQANVHVVSVTDGPLRDTIDEDNAPSRQYAPNAVSVRVGELKALIAKQHNIPAHLQSLAVKHGEAYRSLSDDGEQLDLSEDDEIALAVDLRGGLSCCGFHIDCGAFECKFRQCCFYTGCDAQFNKCQWCCVHCRCG